jgi:hypothetical protein
MLFHPVYECAEKWKEVGPAAPTFVTKMQNNNVQVTGVH